MVNTFDPQTLTQLYRPPEDSHKGQNGKLLVIGGSKLFHASIFWSAQVAAKIVDLVHFCSPAEENNELVRQQLKAGFWEGIVVPWENVGEYIAEDDVILIGPGMPRNEGLAEGETATAEIVNRLVGQYQAKKWVVDGGALQEVNPQLLNGKMIVTPHGAEWERLQAHSTGSEPAVVSKLNNDVKGRNDNKPDQILSETEKALKVKEFSVAHDHLTVLLKGQTDLVCQGENCVKVPGGNPGLTKGGTGDVLAGLVAALYCNNEAFLAVQAGSFVNKKAGESLEKRVGVYYSAGDLVTEVPKVLAGLLS